MQITLEKKDINVLEVVKSKGNWTTKKITFAG